MYLSNLYLLISSMADRCDRDIIPQTYFSAVHDRMLGHFTNYNHARMTVQAVIEVLQAAEVEFNSGT